MNYEKVAVVGLILALSIPAATISALKKGPLAIGQFQTTPRFVYNKETCSKEGITYDSPGSFHSPGYPIEYPNNVQCLWFIKAPTNQVIYITLHNVSLETRYDFVRIYDGSNTKAKLLDEISGRIEERNFLTTQNLATINFTTDYSITKSGFLASFIFVKASCPPGFWGLLCDQMCPRSCEDFCLRETGKCGCGQPIIQPYEGPNIPIRIVGGGEARPGSWPWQVQILWFGNGLCGGSIVNEHWIVTAAHCIIGGANETPYHYHIRVGNYYKDIKDKFEADYPVSEIIVHGNYTGNHNDIALMRVAVPFKYNEWVQPVCLPPPGRELVTDTLVYVTGWGDTEGTGFDDRLKQVVLPIINATTCSILINDNVTHNMICAGYPQGGHSTCYGDSGGPLVLNETNHWSLYGISSWVDDSKHCKKLSGYTKVSNYIDWIKSIIE